MSPTKTCSKCGTEYPRTREYFYEEKLNQDGLSGSCKSCKLTASKFNYQTNKTRRRITGKAWREANRERKRAVSKAWHDANKERESKTHKAWYKTHKEKVLAACKAWAKANPARRRASDRKSKIARKEKIVAYSKAYYEANRERCSIANRAWRQKNRQAVATNKQRRRARKRNASGQFTANQIARLYELQKGRCWWRGPSCSVYLSKGYHIDHRVPLAKGGTNDISNIVLACPHCNLSKQDKLPADFIGRLL